MAARYSESDIRKRLHDLNREIEQLGNLVELEVRRMAREILKKEPGLGQFVKAMGGWFFTDSRDEVIHDSEKDPRFARIRELIRRWDDDFCLTGDPIRFTADGPEITHW